MGEENQTNMLSIVVDGIISSGKTTLIQRCLLPILTKRGWRVTVIEEPVEKWKSDGILQRFYENPSRYGYHFQTKAFHDRVRESQKKYRAFHHCTDLFLCERSIFTDNLFMKCLHESKIIDDLEFQHYQEWWNLWSEVMPFQPDLFVYLKPDLDVCMARLKERSRKEETGISRDYQEHLQRKHDDFLGKEYAEIAEGHYVPCLHLKTNSNFRDDPEIQEHVTTVLEEKIQDILKFKSFHPLSK